MFCRQKIVKNFFKTSNSQNLRNSVKNRCIKVAYIQKLEYAQSFSGRCIQFRIRDKSTSIVLRNKKYGVLLRFMVNNPRLVLLI